MYFLEWQASSHAWVMESEWEGGFCRLGTGTFEASKKSRRPPPPVVCVNYAKDD